MRLKGRQGICVLRTIREMNLLSLERCISRIYTKGVSSKRTYELDCTGIGLKIP